MSEEIKIINDLLEETYVLNKKLQTQNVCAEKASPAQVAAVNFINNYRCVFFEKHKFSTLSYNECVDALYLGFTIQNSEDVKYKIVDDYLVVTTPGCLSWSYVYNNDKYYDIKDSTKSYIHKKDLDGNTFNSLFLTFKPFMLFDITRKKQRNLIKAGTVIEIEGMKVKLIEDTIIDKLDILNKLLGDT